MATGTIIQIKRTANITAPTVGVLAEAELAYAQDRSTSGAGAVLYIKSVDANTSPSIHKVGGKYYTDIVDNATNNNTASTLVKRDSSGNFTASVITAALYGQANSAIIANSANTLTTSRNITLAGDLTGNAFFNGSSDITITATNLGVTSVNGANGAITSVATTSNTLAQFASTTSAQLLGVISDETGTGNLVFSTSPVLVTPNIGTPSYAVLTNATGLPVSTGISGLGANQTTLLAANAHSGAIATTYGSSLNIPVINVDVFGRITSVSNVAISAGGVTSVGGANGAVSNAQLATAIVSSGVLTTSNVAEGANLYFTTARARASIDANVNGGITYNSTTGNVELSVSGVTASTYGSASKVPVFTVDTFGRITSASNVNVASVSSFNASGNTFTISTADGGTFSASIQLDSVRLGTDTTGAYVGNLIAGNGITISGLGNEGTTPTITNSGVTSITGTANQITASSGTGNITLSLPNDVTVNNNLTVSGNLFIKGTATTLQTATVVVNDSLVKFGNANPANSLDIGFFGEYVSGTTKYSGLYRDHIDGKFRLFDGSAVDPTANTISTSDSGYITASLVANLTGGTVSGLTANIAVGDGGTGRGTFTTNGVLLGNTAGALKVTAAGTEGQILVAGADGTPAFASLDGGTF